MDTTTLLTQIIGPIFLIFGVAGVTNKNMMSDFVKGISSNGALPIMGGMFHLIIGMLMVLHHNIWDGNLATTLVTLVAWLMLLKGAWLVLSPKGAVDAAKNMVKGSGVNTAVWIHLIIGAYLTYVGYLVVAAPAVIPAA